MFLGQSIQFTCFTNIKGSKAHFDVINMKCDVGAQNPSLAAA